MTYHLRGKLTNSPNSNMVRGVLLGLVKTELETHLLQAQRRFFVVDDKATQIGTSVGCVWTRGFKPNSARQVLEIKMISIKIKIRKINKF